MADTRTRLKPSLFAHGSEKFRLELVAIVGMNKAERTGLAHSGFRFSDKFLECTVDETAPSFIIDPYQNGCTICEQFKASFTVTNDLFGALQFIDVHQRHDNTIDAVFRKVRPYPHRIPSTTLILHL